MTLTADQIGSLLLLFAAAAIGPACVWARRNGGRG